MPKRAPALDWNGYYDALWRRQYDEQIVKAIENLCGRDLYEQSTLSGMSKYLINRPVSYALHGSEINYPVDCQKIMRWCLIDGRVVLRIGDPQHIRIQEHVREVRYDNEECSFVRIQYYIDDPEGLPGNAQLIYREDYTRTKYVINPDSKSLEESTRWATKVEVYKGQKKEEDLVITLTFTIPFWIFVAIPWIDEESFLEAPKKSIVRLEGAYVQVESENTRHSMRKLFIVGVKKTDNKPTPQEMAERVNYLPSGGEAYYVDSDTGGVSLMFEEEIKLEEAIERMTGVISIKQLANLSGDSRQIAETPLVQLAEEIRTRFEKGMQKVVAILQDYFGLTNTDINMESPDLRINYQFLRIVTDKAQHLAIIATAKEKNAITPDEERREYRRLLNLSQDNVSLMRVAEENI